MSLIALNKSVSLAEIADLIGVNLADKDCNISISSIASLDAADHTSLCFFQYPATKASLRQCKAKAVFISKEYLDDCPGVALVVSNPRLAWAMVGKVFFARPPLVSNGISDNAAIASTAICGSALQVGDFCCIGETAVIGDGSVIGPGTMIGAGVSIGELCKIGSNVSIYPGTTIGRECIIHSGCVIGADGFGFEPDNVGCWHKLEQRSGAIIGDSVEIGANSTIDSGALIPTRIGKGTKIDNLVQIGHGVQIGSHSLICSGCGIGGSAVIGSHCIFGGYVTVADNISLADRTTVKACSMVVSSVVKPGQTLAGMLPARIDKYWTKWIARLNLLLKNSE